MRMQRSLGVMHSCVSCLAWGQWSGRGLCPACRLFAGGHAAGECVGCGRREPVRNQYCRLCWCQARTLARESGNLLHTANAKAANYLHQVRHHQLFFANMASTRGATTTPPRRPQQRGRPRKYSPAPAARPDTTCTQLSLFADLRRQYTRFDEGVDVDLDNPWLAWGQYLAHRLAERRGWSRRVSADVQRSLIILLSGHGEGEVVHYSAMRITLRDRDLNVERVTDVLDEMGIFVDDRRPAFEDWLDDKLDGIAPGIARETEMWLRALRDGGFRVRPHSINSVGIYANVVCPVLRQWSSRYDHLREITHADVLTALNSFTGPSRQHTLIALRSLFGFCTKSGVVFRNPTRRIRVGERKSKLIEPLRPQQIQSAVAAATRPADRLIVALAAVHAARTGAIRALQLDDVDLGNRRLTVAGRARPLDALTHHALLAWLDYRRTRWPNTANPHLVINQITAHELGSVTQHWIAASFRGQDVTLEQLRVDRQLEEALTQGPDPLHLCLVFGLDEKTAIRYADAARQLLESPIERHTPG